MYLLEFGEKKWEKYEFTDISNLLESRLKKYYMRCRAFAFYHAAQQDEQNDHSPLFIEMVLGQCSWISCWQAPFCSVEKAFHE